MKNKSKKTKRSPLCANIDEERILQLSNDVSEFIRSGTVEEWRTVAKYWMHKHDKKNQALLCLKTSCSALNLGTEMQSLAMTEIKAFLKIEMKE